MITRAAAACPATMPLVTNGPFPWQCISVWDRSCIHVADPAGAALAHPGTCFTGNFSPASWWTPLHVTCAAVIAVGVVILAGVAVAALRSRRRSWSTLRHAGGRS